MVGVWGIEWNGKWTKGIRWGGVPLIVAWIEFVVGALIGVFGVLGECVTLLSAEIQIF